MDTDQQNVWFSIWSKAIDTQMHFNDMSARSRQFGLGFVTAALSFGIVLLTQQDDYSFMIHIGNYIFQLHASVLIILASIVSLWSVRQLDLNVYHKMLRGSVAFGIDFEEHYMKQIFSLEKGMTQAIRHFSQHQDAKIEISNGKLKYSGAGNITAFDKIKVFYNIAGISLIVLAILVFLSTAKFRHQ